MDFFAPIQIPSLSPSIAYGQKIMLTGSCFTEHIGDRLSELKFEILQNPNGILFDPYSVASSLRSYINPRIYTENDLIQFNELWHSWQHHSRFSSIDVAQSVATINASQREAHLFLAQADWLIITLGSSFSYRLQSSAPLGALDNINGPVANCHRAPGSWFTKYLMPIEETLSELDQCLHQLFHFNPKLKVLFTISPVRHLRDGVIDNNRSKARLVEVVHHLVNKFDRIHYFPAYELVVDVLRDYRFYDIDLAHPNYAATKYVMEQFMLHCVEERSRSISEQVMQIVTARKHKAFQPATHAHKQFLKQFALKTSDLMKEYPFLNLNEELNYFSEDAPPIT